MNYNASSPTSDFGNFIITGVSGTELNDFDIKILETVRPIGILFLKRNFDHEAPYEVWLEKFSKLISDIKKRTGRSKLFLTVDHEGGKVQRTPSPITNFGAPRKHASKATAVAKANAVELKSLGINVSWSPLADINTNPENPIIGKLDRSFGENAADVSRYAVEYYQGLISEGVLGCAKHFPGHGDTWSDSHLELPIVSLTLDAATNRELLPFKALIEIDVAFVMTAHVMFPDIDKENPATFSPKIITDVLRNELGFQNIIVADDVNMKAVADKFKTIEGVAQTFKAGIDMMLVGRYPEPDKDNTPVLLCNLMKECVTKGLIDSDRLKQSYQRIERILSDTIMPTPKPLEASIFDAHKILANSI